MKKILIVAALSMYALPTTATAAIIYGDFDGATLHVRPEMHAGVADEGDAPTRHTAADPFDLAEVAEDLQLVTGFPLDREKIVHAMLSFPQMSGKGSDFIVGESRRDVRRERLDFERDLGLLFQSQCNLRISAPFMRSISTG